MDDSTIFIQLGVEELIFLLRTLRIKTLPGLGEDPTAGLEEDQIKRALAAGFNSLRARGWVQAAPAEEGAGVVVDSVIAALLGTCAMARHILFINRQPVDGPAEANYVHFGPHLTAIHGLAEPGVHQMIGTVDEECVLSSISQMLHLDGQPPPAPENIQIPQETLDLVTAALREGELSRGATALGENDVSENLVEALIGSMDSMVANSAVAMLHLDQGQALRSADGFALLEGASGFWLLRTREGDSGDGEILIRPIAAEECLEQIKGMIWESQ